MSAQKAKSGRAAKIVGGPSLTPSRHKRMGLAAARHSFVLSISRSLLGFKLQPSSVNYLTHARQRAL